MKRLNIVWYKRLAHVAALALAVCAGLAMVVPDADAARMGGGRSFGRQSGNVTRQAAPPSQAAPTQQAGQRQTPPPAAQPQPAGNRWFGPIAGLAAGLGIAALLSHFGLGAGLAEALGSVLVIAALVFIGLWIWRMLRGSTGNRPALSRAPEPAYSGVGDTAPQRTFDLEPQSARPGSVAALAGGATSAASAASAPTAQWGVPAGFDTQAFIRSAKVNFIRLQEAWDAKNLSDLREFTTPEVFAELKMQMDESRGVANHTDVVSLDAELLGIEESPTDYLASVKFSGTIRENEQGDGAPVEEVWNLTKAKSGRSGWLLAGIQQIH